MVTTLKRTWKKLMGLGQKSAPQAELAEKYAHFQQLLAANNQVLALMIDMEEKLSGDFLFDFQYIRSTVTKLLQETGSLVTALNGMSGGRHLKLREAFENVSGEVTGVLDHRREKSRPLFPVEFADLLEPHGLTSIPCARR